VTAPQKVLCSFLLSTILVAGIVSLAVTGIFADYSAIAGESAQILMLVVIFLTLFLIIFLCFNVRRDSAEEPQEADLMPATDFTSATDLASAEAVQAESVTGLGGSFFMFRQPFAFMPGNPELLQSVETEVVYEQDGIHYINNSVFADDEKREEFDNNFAKLVESVVNKIDTSG